MHLVGADGGVLRSFGMSLPSYRADEPLLYERVVAPSANGTLWAAAPGQYVLERWEWTTGTRVARVAVRSGWFRPSRQFAEPRVRPNPIIEALWESQGLLWVLIRDADSKWIPPTGPQLERAFDLEEYNKTYDSVIEVVDPKSGEIRATKRFDQALWGRAPSRLLASPRVNKQAGSVRLDVWRPEVRKMEKNR